MSTSTISPLDLAEVCKSGMKIDLIDVRTPMEYQELHVANARNVPLDQLDPVALMQTRNGSSQETLYVICRSGGRGKQACEKFLKAGFTNVVTSGAARWLAHKLGFRSSEARKRFHWSGRFELQPARWCC